MNHKNHHPILGATWMVLAGSAFACANTGLQYLGMKLGLASTMAAFLQYGIALLLMLPFVRLSGLKTALQSKHRHLHILRILISVVGIQLWTFALAHVPIWQAIALLMTSPLFATLGSGIFLNEKVRPMRWSATLLGFVGTMIILAPWSDAFSYYSLLPLAAAFFWAWASLMTKYSLNDDSPSTVIAYLFVLMLPINALFVASNEFVLPSSQNAWLLLMVIAALTAFAQWAIAKAYSSAEASYLQPFDHAKLPLNVLAGFVVFHYTPPGQLWLGSAIIIAAVTFITQHEQRLKSKMA